LDWKTKATHFLKHETQFHLGMLPTEQSHPATRGLAETLQRDTAAGIAMLQSVDRNVAQSADRVLADAAFAELTEAMSTALRTGGRVCFSGCGATGRLSILLEACWRHFWLDVAGRQPELRAICEEMSNAVCSIMTGGDYALIRSVEKFEDHISFGRQQVKEAGLGRADVLVAISEGGETSSVIGTIQEAHERGARTFFLFNNPAHILARHIERSRDVIEDPSVVILDLSSGPMAVAGSTRMQATTSELLVAGAALELALGEVCRDKAPDCLSDEVRTPRDYIRAFNELLAELEAPDAVQAMVEWTDFERALYESEGLVTYFADGCLLDIFADTTERAPTFMLPPFRKCDDTVSPPSWAFVKNPLLQTADAWERVLGRAPRCLDWDRERYAELGAPGSVQENPPRLSATEIHKFVIGNEDDPSRHGTADNAAVLAALASELTAAGSAPNDMRGAFADVARPFARRAAVVIGEECAGIDGVDGVFHVPCTIPSTPLRLWERLAVKLVFNTVSTATMGCMGRLISNWMAHVETTNKKLIDRGSRLVSELAGVDYETACHALHETSEMLAASARQDEQKPSPVALTIERLRETRARSGGAVA
jgi:N-acetylmuramic acid 6-phosphate etherase